MTEAAVAVISTFDAVVFSVMVHFYQYPFIGLSVVDSDNTSLIEFYTKAFILQ
ncbi:hypothetical protein BCR42DRAFT_423538 [Absidia repens]|uniref:Uncharacterized protein n=1 Tax=Absidia repens TaxID=90262 RepID=A0A1X2I4W3_9FUNG|nr:hypothetical protein BCR42DRAFT_423538 [Absidia repens]